MNKLSFEKFFMFLLMVAIPDVFGATAAPAPSVQVGASMETNQDGRRGQKHPRDNNGGDDDQSAAKKQKIEFCTVCQCDVDSTDHVFKLDSCGHVFHADCIFDCLLVSGKLSCPVCRKDIVLKECLEKLALTFKHNLGKQAEGDNNEHLTFLHIAVRQNDEASVAVLLNNPSVRANINAQTVVMMHDEYGQLEVVLDDVSHTPLLLDTPLHIAVSNGNERIAKMLLQAGADQNKCRFNDQTPLILAVSKNHTDMMKLLLRKGVHDKCLDRNVLAQFLKGAAVGVLDAEVIKIVANGINVNMRDRDGKTPLHWAARNGCVDAVKTLLSVGANKDARDAQGCTPLLTAVMFGNADVVQVLLAAGVKSMHEIKEDQKGFFTRWFDRTANTAFGLFPYNRFLRELMSAVAHNHVEVVKVLLNAGAQPNAPVFSAGNQLSPLALARQRGNNEIAELLIQHGAIEE